jgi:hypothetical protein
MKRIRFVCFPVESSVVFGTGLSGSLELSAGADVLLDWVLLGACMLLVDCVLLDAACCAIVGCAMAIASRIIQCHVCGMRRHFPSLRDGVGIHAGHLFLLALAFNMRGTSIRISIHGARTQPAATRAAVAARKYE